MTRAPSTEPYRWNQEWLSPSSPVTSLISIFERNRSCFVLFRVVRGPESCRRSARVSRHRFADRRRYLDHWNWSWSVDTTLSEDCSRYRECHVQIITNKCIIFNSNRNQSTVVSGTLATSHIFSPLFLRKMPLNIGIIGFSLKSKKEGSWIH